MGQKISRPDISEFKKQQIDINELQKFVKNIKTQQDIEEAIRKFLSIMSINQKIGQLQQISYGDQQISEEIANKIIRGQVGSFLNTSKVSTSNAMQKIAMQKSRLKIPLLLARDVIHGFRTIFPIPLAQGASFNPQFTEQASRIAAIESSSIGIKWTFAPMVDIARDPRWGRVAQGYGEDPYLTSIMGAASVKGFQNSLKDTTSIAACAKHYVGYGATQGGRDYNTTLIAQNSLRDVYLPSFKACHESGCLTFMSAFNDLNGSPSSANSFILKTILRQEWKFNGIVVSDWQSIAELIEHGYAANEQDAARRAFNNGVDMEMNSTCFADHLENLFSKRASSLADLDTKVANILRVKFKLNLFLNYYTDPERQKIILNPQFKEKAKSQALECPVLLQNKNKTLPIRSNIKKIAVIGELADDGDNQMGWAVPDGRGSDVITPLTSLRQSLPNTQIVYSKAYKDPRSFDTSLFQEAIKIAASSELILLFVGQDSYQSGQSHSRAYISLPGSQQELVRQIAKIGKPVVLVVIAGRPTLLEKVLPLVDSVLFAWQLGTMAGPALADLLTGKTSPSGKISLSFPRTQGQIPTYYNKKNTGRPNESHQYVPETSSYIDIDTTPLFPFGYGLTYSSFSYSGLKLSKNKIKFGQSLLVSATIKNQGSVKAKEVVFLFIRDLVGSFTRPVKQLKDFQKIVLSPGQSRSVTFTTNSSKIAFWTAENEWKAQPGKFNIWIGPNSLQGLIGNFQLLAQEDTEFQIF